MTQRTTNQVARSGEIFCGPQLSASSSVSDALRSERQQHDRDGTDFPFKISSGDLTGCHYCAALSDGSADERAIAAGNRHEKVDQMEARDTQPLEGRRQRTALPQKLFTFIWCAAFEKNFDDNFFLFIPRYSKRR